MSTWAAATGHSHKSAAGGQMVWGEQGGPPAGSHPPGSGGTPLHCCRQPRISPEGVSLCRLCEKRHLFEIFDPINQAWFQCCDMIPHVCSVGTDMQCVCSQSISLLLAKNDTHLAHCWHALLLIMPTLTTVSNRTQCHTYAC